MELRKLNVCANKTRDRENEQNFAPDGFTVLKGIFANLLCKLSVEACKLRTQIFKWMSILRDDYARVFVNLSPQSGSFSTGRSTTQHSPHSLCNSDLLVFPGESLILTKDDPKVILRRSPLEMENGWVGSAPLPRRVRKYFRFLSAREKCLNNNILALDWHWEL